MFRKIIEFILAIIIIIFTPFILLLLTPIFIFRYIIAKNAKYLNSSLGKILTTKSTCVGVDDINGTPQWTLILAIVLKGTPSLDGIRQKFEKNVIQAKTPADEFLKPELRQYVSSWFGFLFWKWDKDFNVENHIYKYIGELRNEAGQITEADLFKFGQTLIYKSYTPKRSPWELILVENVKLDDENENEEGDDVTHSVIFLRAHHVLADGFSLLKLFIMDICQAKRLSVAAPSSNVPTSGWKYRLIKYLGPFYMVLRGPFDLAAAMLDVMANNKNDWHLPEKQLKRSLNSAISSTIPIRLIKDIKNLCKCSFGSVLLAAYTGALRKFMEEAGHRVPDNILCAIALPIPNHPRHKLRNHATGVLVRLPTGLPNSYKRLRAVHENQEELKNSTLPITIFHCMTVIGGLFAIIVKMLTKNTVTTAVGSIFPGPNRAQQSAGFTAIKITYAGGLTRGNTGLGFSSLSYNNKMSVIVGVDDGIVDSSKLPAQKLLDYMQEELLLLRDIAEAETNCLEVVVV